MRADDYAALRDAAYPVPGFGGRPCSAFNPDMARYRRMATEGLVEIRPWVCGDFIISATAKGHSALPMTPDPKAE